MSHHCTKSINDKLLFFVNGKRVSDAHYRSHYNVNVSECLTKEQRKNILKQSITNYQNLKRDHAKILSSCKEKLGKCNKRVSDLEASLLKSAETFTKTCEKDKQALEQTIRALRATQNDDRKYDEELEKLRGKLRTTQSAFDDEKKSLISKLRSFETERQTFEKSIRDATNRSAECDKKYAQVLSDKNAIEQDRNELRIEIEKLSRSIQGLTNEIRQKTLEMEELMRKPKTIAEDKSLKQTIQVNQSVIAELTNERDALAQDRNNKQTQIQALSDDLSALRQQSSTERETLLREIEDAKQRLAENDRQRQALNQELETIRAENRLLSSEHETLGQELAEIERSRTQMKIDYGALSREMDQVKHHLAENDADNKALRQQLASRDGNLVEMREELKNILVERDTLRQELSEIKRLMEQKDNAYQTLSQEMERIKEERDQCREQLMYTKYELQETNESLTKISNINAEQLSKISAITTDLKNMTAERDSEKIEHIKTQEAFTKHQYEYAELTRRLTRELDECDKARQTLIDDQTSSRTKIDEYKKGIEVYKQAIDDLTTKVSRCASDCDSRIEALNADFGQKERASNEKILELTDRIKALDKELSKEQIARRDLKQFLGDEQIAHRQTNETFSKYKNNAEALLRKTQDKLDDCNRKCEETTQALKDAFAKDLSANDTKKFTETRKALESQNRALVDQVNQMNNLCDKVKADLKLEFEQKIEAEKSLFSQKVDELREKEKEELENSHRTRLDQIRREFDQANAEKDAKLAATEQKFVDIDRVNKEITKLLDAERANSLNLRSTNSNLAGQIDQLIKSQEYKQGMAMMNTERDNAEKIRSEKEQEDRRRQAWNQKHDERQTAKSQAAKAKEDARKAKEVSAKEGRVERGNIIRQQRLETLKSTLEANKATLTRIQSEMEEKRSTERELKRVIRNVEIVALRKSQMLVRLFAAAQDAETDGVRVTEVVSQLTDEFKQKINSEGHDEDVRMEILKALDEAAMTINIINHNQDIENVKKDLREFTKRNNEKTKEATQKHNNNLLELKQTESDIAKYRDMIKEAQLDVDNAQGALDSFKREHNFAFRSKRSASTKNRIRRSPSPKKKNRRSPSSKNRKPSRHSPSPKKKNHKRRSPSPKNRKPSRR